MVSNSISVLPQAQGLYDPGFEHDACGVAFVATLTGRATHELVQNALVALKNLDHRGAAGADPATGDGAGILTQIPHNFFQQQLDFDLPASGSYAAGLVFLPSDTAAADLAMQQIAAIAQEEQITILGWRDVPVRPESLGAAAIAAMPTFKQLVLAVSQDGDWLSGLELERKAYVLRKRSERDTDVYFASLSGRTLVYKGMLTTAQLGRFYPDLSDPAYESKLALVHSRFSTNTFPSWPLAQPFRIIAHNGEINTVKGNRNWMQAREATLASDLIDGDLSRLFPICSPSGSDSASFDEVLELLHLGGRSLPHAVLMMIPEAWENNHDMDPQRRAFYQFHASLMEPWDGPASVSFTDGSLIGAVLDRNGLRPGRYWVTDDGLVVLGSEAGVLDIDPKKVVRRGRLRPGRMFLVDTVSGRIIEDDEIKQEIANAEQYQRWLAEGLVHLDEVPDREHIVHTAASVKRRQQAFGYTEEELRIVLKPMASTGTEAIGSMGTDTPIAALSSRPRLLFDYFSQIFAQVTNPPLDAIREEIVTSLQTVIGPERNLLSPHPHACRHINLSFPVIDNDQLAKILHIADAPGVEGFRSKKISSLYRVELGAHGLETRLEEIFREIDAAVAHGVNFIVLSDRDSDMDFAPIPSLLATSAVHHHLVRNKTRTQVSLVVESGDVREVHHVALLVGYGAAAVNPYLAMESVEDLVRDGTIQGLDSVQAIRNLVKALGKGVLKVMSKMGISTIASYRGAQVFEALGLSQELTQRYFTGTSSKLGGIGLAEIARDIERRHRVAYPVSGITPAHRSLVVGGEYQWRREGPPHLFNPDTVFRLQHATRTKRYDIFKEYTDLVDNQAKSLMTLRGLFTIKSADRESIPIEQVEPVSEIVKRFATGAMSYGSISQEAHETLAIAMNRLGAKSNTGEGGEDPERWTVDENGDSRRSAIKQVASGRFGVTSAYLVNADDIQIKMAQGAKPGEGGQLPAHKVYPWIARTRHSTPGVGLISPPPHHDIYSIEDLAQLIYDLKNANSRARINVKLVAEAGVGTVAAGVTKAHADVILISGHDGGTGASPLTSLKHAGGPWELGLAETQQTLLLNGLRDRVTIQTDGQLKTGRDVLIAALLGAEEYGFATGPLVVMGCVMMRVCHLNTCPVGVATQNPILRDRFTGEADHVVNFFEFIAQQVREYLAELGFRSLDEAIGHSELIDASAAITHWKTEGLDLAPILQQVEVPSGTALICQMDQDHSLDQALDQELIQLSQAALDNAQPVRASIPIRNTNRAVGTMLGSEVTRRFGQTGLPDNTIDLQFEGSAGQSFGAFVPRGLTLRVQGDANDYVGKGLSGGRIVIRPDSQASLESHRNTIAGNVIAYGATSGEIFLSGKVGERCCVRNSGATVVVEGAGDHLCEYMTGGQVVVLGPTGRNIAAGMSGGIAYILDLDERQLNQELVDLEPLASSDREALYDLVLRHAQETESVVAQQLLQNWESSVTRFSKVMPRDYKRVLAAIAQAELAGLNVDEAIMEAANG